MKKSLLLGVTLLAALQAGARADINDPGFNTPDIASNSFQYNPVGGAWAFTGTSAIVDGNNAFTSGNPGLLAAGQQAAALQFANGAGGSVSQAFGLSGAGNYTLTFSAASRTFEFPTTSFRVTIDNTSFTYVVTSTSFTTITQSGIALGAGGHTITFTELSGGSDTTTFIDNVVLTNPVPEPGSLVMLGLGLVTSTGVLARRKFRTA